MKVKENDIKVGDLSRRVEITNVKCAQTFRLYNMFDATDHTTYKEQQTWNYEIYDFMKWLQSFTLLNTIVPK
jgi:hypothetical protein